MLSEANLKRLVLFQGVLLVAGLVLVVVTIIYRLFNPEDGVGAAPEASAAFVLPEAAGRAIAVPAGSELEGYTTDGAVLILHLTTGEGRDRILVLNVAEGRILGDYELAPQ